MFTLVTISDLVQISPEDFEKPSIQAIEDNINAKYADRVIQRVGLCIGLYDIQSSSDGLIGHGTGIVNVNVTFRLVVFRPFKGEIIEGRIASTSPDGVAISLGDWFQDVWVKAPHALFEPSRLDEKENVWIWDAEGNEMYFDKHEVARVRVELEEWNDQTPKKPAALSSPAAQQEEKEKKPPYALQASMARDALGPNYWWEGEGD